MVCFDFETYIFFDLYKQNWHLRAFQIIYHFKNYEKGELLRLKHKNGQRFSIIMLFIIKINELWNKLLANLN